MPQVNADVIEQEASELRADELRHYPSVLAAYGAVYPALFAGALEFAVQSVSRALRPLFSWNPDAR